MKKLFWFNGRFSWPLVGAIVFFTASVVAADLAWRVLTMQFDTLLILVVVADALAAALLIATYRFLRRRTTRSP